jgi:hypothetical protein
LHGTAGLATLVVSRSMLIGHTMEHTAMIAISLADTDLVRRATERLHQFDLQAAAGCYFELVTTTNRLRLLFALDIARGAAMA